MVKSHALFGVFGKFTDLVQSAGRLLATKEELQKLTIMIRVLVVDDSEVDRKLITYALNKERNIEVIGCAENPYVAKDMINLLKPDVITLDLQMPRMNGLTFLGKIMQIRPFPVIIVSSYTLQNSSYALKALNLGALDTISKPGLEYSLKEFSKRLVRMVREAKGASIMPPGRKTKRNKKGGKVSHVKVKGAGRKLIAIGSSTGGTRAIEFLMNELPTGLPGIMIVQHLPETFTKSFAARLNAHSALDIREASDKEVIRPGCVYIAPGNQHMKVRKQGGSMYVQLIDGDRLNYHRPSVDVLFNSVAEQVGPSATGVILTGMGSDGAEGLLKMKNNGAHTIGQDEASSVIYGMPKVAYDKGAVMKQLPLKEIPGRIVKSLTRDGKDLEQEV